MTFPSRLAHASRTRLGRPSPACTNAGLRRRSPAAFGETLSICDAMFRARPARTETEGLHSNLKRLAPRPRPRPLPGAFGRSLPPPGACLTTLGTLKIGGHETVPE